MKKFEFIPASRATRNGTNKTSTSGDENGESFRYLGNCPLYDSLNDKLKLLLDTGVNS